jgi:hypothetical protein
LLSGSVVLLSIDPPPLSLSGGGNTLGQPATIVRPQHAATQQNRYFPVVRIRENAEVPQKSVDIMVAPLKAPAVL